jgi:hypothetical protein
MSITSQLKSIASAISGINFRTTLIADAQMFETEINRISAEVDPVISPTGAITLGGVQRTTWPAAGGTASAFNDVLQNGSVGNLPSAASSFQVNDTGGTSLFSVDKATGNVTIKGAITAIGGVMPVYAVDTGAANAYVIALNPTISSYTRSFQGTFKAANANTGASTINAGGGVIPLVNDIGGALAANDILAGDMIEFQYSLTDNKAYVTSTIQSQNDARYFQLSQMDPSLFYKPSPMAHCFTKTAGATISVNAGTSVVVAGIKILFATTTAVVMPSLVAGTDYAIYVCTDGTIRADSSFSYPSGYTAGNSRMIGGFHYGLIAAGTTATIANGFNITASTTHAVTTANTSAVVTAIASTADLMMGMNVSGTGIPASTYILSVDSGTQITLSNAATAAGSPTLTFTNTGMVWTQSNVDDIAGINKYSIWDLKFRPKSSSPVGMALVNGQTWVDIYLCSTDTAANGTSKYNTNIASGTVLPKIPAAFGGNGTVTYTVLDWWTANELARANQKRLMWEHEFVDAMYGVCESHSIDNTAATYPTTLRNAGYTSKYGIEEATGHIWVWGQDSNFYYDTTSWTWKDINGNTGAAGSGRGQVYTEGTYGLVRVILGGNRAGGSGSGSRASYWSFNPWGSSWNVGLRAACDHMISV